MYARFFHTVYWLQLLKYSMEISSVFTACSDADTAVASDKDFPNEGWRLGIANKFVGHLQVIYLLWSFQNNLWYIKHAR